METTAVDAKQECYAINTACYREIPKIQGLPIPIQTISLNFLAESNAGRQAMRPLPRPDQPTQALVRLIARLFASIVPRKVT